MGGVAKRKKVVPGAKKTAERTPTAATRKRGGSATPKSAERPPRKTAQEVGKRVSSRASKVVKEKAVKGPSGKGPKVSVAAGKKTAQAAPKAPRKRILRTHSEGVEVLLEGIGMAPKNTGAQPSIPALDPLHEFQRELDEALKPVLESIGARLGEIVGPKAAAAVDQVRVEMQRDTRKALLSFASAESELGAKREQHLHFGFKAVLSAMATKAALPGIIAQWAGTSLLSDLNPPERVQRFSLSAPSYFPKLIHMVTSLLKERVGAVRVDDWEVIEAALFFTMIHMDEFAKDPNFVKKFGANGLHG